MFISPFTFYIANMSLLSFLGFYIYPRTAIIRLYAGSVLSMMGVLTVWGYIFPIPTIQQFLAMMQAALVLDTINSTEQLLLKVSGFFICQALTNVPDIMYATALGIYAIAPTYFVLGSIVPSVYFTGAQGVLHVAQIVSAVFYLLSVAIPIYTCSLHLIFLTLSVYEFGKWISGSRAE